MCILSIFEQIQHYLSQLHCKLNHKIINLKYQWNIHRVFPKYIHILKIHKKINNLSYQNNVFYTIKLVKQSDLFKNLCVFVNKNSSKGNLNYFFLFATKNLTLWEVSYDANNTLIQQFLMNFWNVNEFMEHPVYINLKHKLWKINNFYILETREVHLYIPISRPYLSAQIQKFLL